MRIPRLIMALALIAVLGNLPAGTSTSGGRLEVVVTGARNAQGVLRTALFRGSEGFPGKDEQAIGRLVAPASTGPVTFLFKDIPPGEYAAAVLHDEDNNGKMNSNWLGMPREGYGTSNNPEGRPKYKKSRFDMASRTLRMEIRLVYR